jgi:hypothetical protein
MKSNFVILVLLTTVITNSHSAELAESLPNFSLRGVDEKLYTNEDFVEKDLLAVIFLSNHCRVSQIFQNQLIKLSDVFKKEKVGIVAVSPNYEQAILPDELAYSDLGDSFQEMKKRADRMNYNFPYLYDGVKQDFTRKIGVKITPTVFLYNKNRKLIYVGRIGNHEASQRLDSSDLYKSIKSNLTIGGEKFKRTKVFGTSIKFIDDLDLAEQVRKRYAGETVKTSYADERKLKFYLTQLTGKPKLFYIWRATDRQTRDNLITISTLYKIFRKRGLKVITVCIAEKENNEDANELLKQAQLSSTNFIVSGSQVSPLTTIMPDDIKSVTPFYRLLGSDGKMLGGGKGEVSKDRLRLDILHSLKRE